MTSRRTKISPKTGRGLGHVTHTILAVRSAILATAWLLVSCRRLQQQESLGKRAKKPTVNQREEHNVEKYIQWVTTLSPIRRYDTIGEFNVDSKAEFIFIILAVVASQIREIAQNSLKIRTCSSSRSSKAIDLGVNRKQTCNLLLVILTLDVWSYYLF